MRLIAVGDIHGQAWKLRDLLGQIYDLPLSDDDRIVFVGDYVDRGPEVRLTIEILMRLEAERPNTIFLRGNHEQELMDVRDVLDPNRRAAKTYDEVSWWFKYGGQPTIDSYGGGPEWYRRIPIDHWTFLERTRLEYREGGYIFVHAGLLPPGRSWFEADDPRLWIRSEFIESPIDFGGAVVFGHTPMMDGRPLVMQNKIGIDTAAGYGGPLTAAVLEPFDPESVRFIQA